MPPLRIAASLYNVPMVRMLRQLRGTPRRTADGDLLRREIDLSNVSVDVLRRIFHAGSVHGLIAPRRPVNREKAEWLQSYLSERLDPDVYHWEFIARWVED